MRGSVPLVFNLYMWLFPPSASPVISVGLLVSLKDAWPGYSTLDNRSPPVNSLFSCILSLFLYMFSHSPTLV